MFKAEKRGSSPVFVRATIVFWRPKNHFSKLILIDELQILVPR
jgi:hypothetical protein